MTDQYVAEIRITPYNFAPAGWAMCNGQLLAISQNTALFSLLGTNFGGNGTSNFGLPNLQGRVPMFWGQGAGLSLYDIGEQGGEATHTLLASELPGHQHPLAAFTGRGAAAMNVPAANSALTASQGGMLYGNQGSPNVNLAPGTLGPGPGGNQAHNNLMPYLTLNFVIALVGIYPPRS